MATCWPVQTKRRRLALVLFLLLLVILLLSSFEPLREPVSQEEKIPKEKLDFRLLIPASKADTNLCKSLVSSTILGYPAPTLVNWKDTYNTPNLIFGGAHLAKIGGVLAQLKNLTKEHDDDLVLVVDGYDVWFQLRPDVLIRRFYDINRRANERLSERFGETVTRKQGISQSVVFSAQKRCWPKGPEHPACWAVPQSSLPPHVYGPKTDTDIGDPANPYIKFRQRYLNSGSVIGPVSAVREIFERAAAIAGRDANIGSDQGVFAQMHGEQEFYRHFVAMASRTLFKRATDWILKRLGMEYSYKLIDHEKQGHRQFVNLAKETKYEFGIGLDYESRIIHATVFSENDSEWIARSDKGGISRVSTEKNIPRLHVGALSRDIQTSAGPFEDLRRRAVSDESTSKGKTWADVPLFTNLWTGVSPVAIHHDAHRNGLKRRINSHWNRTWYQNQSRYLLTSRVLAPQGPVAVTKVNGIKQRWYDPATQDEAGDKNLIFTDRGDKIHYDQLCAGTWQEIFRDDKGEWTDPRGKPGDSNSRENQDLSTQEDSHNSSQPDESGISASRRNDVKIMP